MARRCLHFFCISFVCQTVPPPSPRKSQIYSSLHSGHAVECPTFPRYPVCGRLMKNQRRAWNTQSGGEGGLAVPQIQFSSSSSRAIQRASPPTSGSAPLTGTPKALKARETAQGSGHMYCKDFIPDHPQSPTHHRVWL